MPSNIDASLWTPPTVLAQNPRGATRVDMRDGTRGFVPPPPAQGLIFEELWSGQPDWNSGLPVNVTSANPAGLADRVQITGTHLLPENWYACRQQCAWGPSVGYPAGFEAIEIANTVGTEFEFPGQTKVCLHLAESRVGSGMSWNSESTLMRLLNPSDPINGYSEVYAEFWIKFGSTWTFPRNQSKLFRISSWNGDQPPFEYFSGGHHGPTLVWDWLNNTAVRNSLHFRGGPWGSNYGMDESRMIGGPTLINQGDAALNFTSQAVGYRPGGLPMQIPDQLNGGYIPQSGAVQHNQVFGTAWHKIAFYVRMNSTPSAFDGAMIQWFNDQRLFINEQINWCPTEKPGGGMPTWNCLDLGGNDNFTTYGDAERRQERYAFGPVHCFSHIPAWAEM